MINTQAAIKDQKTKYAKWICGEEIARVCLAGGCVYIEYENYRCPVCGYTVDYLRFDVNGELVDRYCPMCNTDMLSCKGE